MPAPQPTNEADRLQTLQAYDVLDSPPEAAFERLVNLAAQACAVPIAIISPRRLERRGYYNNATSIPD